MTGEAAGLPEQAFAAALATVRGVGPRRLRLLLESAPPSEAWQSLLRGRPDDPDRALRRAAGAVEVSEVWRVHRRSGVGVLLRDDPRYPEILARDPEGPAVLFHLGDPAVVDGRPIAVLVGTRSATRYGLGVAAQLGADLATDGIAVASGLALGVDGAAHEGCTPVGGPGARAPHRRSAVVANGLDSPYPARHARLWERVAESGVVLSETPVGVGAERWRFLHRNRLMAALADVVVVVECHVRGGSLSTVAAAVERGVPVGAVPGSIRSPASAGTNALLADGVLPGPRRDRRARGDRPGAGGPPPPPHARRRPRRRRRARSPRRRRERSPAGVGGGRPRRTRGGQRCTLEEVLRSTGRPLGEVSEVLEALATEGTVHGEGGWWSRTTDPDRPERRP